jgi:hypothetical protein
MTTRERAVWLILTASTAAAAVFGYHRFREVRPDVFQDPAATQAAERRRLERIRAYHERARAQAWGRSGPVPAPLEPGQRCVDGLVVEVRSSAEGSVVARVEQDGEPVPCAND